MYIYDDELLQQINSQVDLLEYVQRTLELKRQGNDFFASCKHHIDLTPSLSFTPAKNSYYCFSCGRSGGAIGYLMDYEGLSFEDAVKKASQLAEIDLSSVCKSETMAFLKRIEKSNKTKKETYQHNILPEAAIERYKKCDIELWANEGIKQEVMDIFGIRIDDYGNRIVYPVRNIYGNLINVKGRTMYENYKQLRIPKYINYYEVGVMDYFQSLDIALPFVKESKEIIIFESIKSTMLAYGWEYKNCVSAEKHTLTDEQVDLLIKLRVNVVFAYDSDVDYNSSDVRHSIDKLKRITNVYVLKDRKSLLGGKDSKKSPADCGKDVFLELYNNKQKVI